MDDNYINFNFNTLDDLNNIPGKLEELNDLQLQLKDIAESKLVVKGLCFGFNYQSQQRKVGKRNSKSNIRYQ